jgi:hypothetical protein
MNSIATQTTAGTTDNLPATVVQSIVQALSGLRYGQVTIIVQDGRVIQIDRTERHRFTAEKDARSEFANQKSH